MWVCVLVPKPQVVQASQSRQGGAQQVNSYPFQAIMPMPKRSQKPPFKGWF